MRLLYLFCSDARQRYQNFYSVLFVFFVSVGACSTSSTKQSPEVVLEQFLLAVEESSQDPSAQKRAFALLDLKAQESLRIRAHQMSLNTGKLIPPESMWFLSWVPIRFSAERMQSKIEPSQTHATVDVWGADPSTQHTQISMVYEANQWRVVVEIPSTLSNTN